MSKELKRRGLLKKHVAIDYEVWKWKERLGNSRGSQRITKNEIQAYARRVYENAGVTSFKASDGWYRRWRQRWSKPRVGIQNKTTNGDGNEETNKLKSDVECGFADIVTTNKSKDEYAYTKSSNKTRTKYKNCSEILSKRPNNSDLPCNIGYEEYDQHLTKENLSTDKDMLLNSCDSSDRTCNKDIQSKNKQTRFNLGITHDTIEEPEPDFQRPVSLISATSNTGNTSDSIVKYSDSNLTHMLIETSMNNKELKITNEVCSEGVSKNDSLCISVEANTTHPHLGITQVFCAVCEDIHSGKKEQDSNCQSGLTLNDIDKKDPNSNSELVRNSSDQWNCQKKVTPKNVPKKLLPECHKTKRYLMQFKSKVVNYALSHKAKEAADKYNVNRCTVYEWLKEHKQSLEKNTKLNHVQQLQSESVPSDSEFITWLESSKFNITNELLKQKAVEWLELEGVASSKIEWLHMYTHRLIGREDHLLGKRYITYPEAFKRMVVFHAQTHSNMSAARVFGVDRRRVIQWQDTFNGSKTKEFTAAVNLTNEEVDKKIFEWFIRQYPSPSSKQVRNKGVELYRAAGHNAIQCGSQWYYRWRARHKLPPARDNHQVEEPLLSWALTQLDNNKCVTHVELTQAYSKLNNVTVSRAWTFRFCKKYYKLLQTIPDFSTRLPSSMEKHVTSFLKRLQDLIASYKDTDVVSMDEIALHFLPKGSSTKPLLIRRPGFECCHASLMVSSRADGTLLPTMFVFKGPPPSCSHDSCVVAVANDSGLVSEEIMTQWLSRVCFKQQRNTHGILITDCFDVHTSESVQQIMKDHQWHHTVIPGGCSFRLQPLTSLCQLFKSRLEDMCQASWSNQTTPPTPEQLYLWAVRVHKHLSKNQKENVFKAFRDMKIIV